MSESLTQLRDAVLAQHQPGHDGSVCFGCASVWPCIEYSLAAALSTESVADGIHAATLGALEHAERDPGFCNGVADRFLQASSVTPGGGIPAGSATNYGVTLTTEPRPAGEVRRTWPQ